CRTRSSACRRAMTAAGVGAAASISPKIARKCGQLLVVEAAARIASSTAAARRAHERALHDGVQQDLIAAAVRLQLARELVASEPTAAIALLDELRADLHSALDRVRAVADEIYPSVLDARGLPDALRTLGITTEGLGRYPVAIEAAVYFCCR